jgi:hypothetical protein
MEPAIELELGWEWSCHLLESAPGWALQLALDWHWTGTGAGNGAGIGAGPKIISELAETPDN